MGIIENLQSMRFLIAKKRIINSHSVDRNQSYDFCAVNYFIFDTLHRKLLQITPSIPRKKKGSARWIDRHIYQNMLENEKKNFDSLTWQTENNFFPSFAHSWIITWFRVLHFREIKKQFPMKHIFIYRRLAYVYAP